MSYQLSATPQMDIPANEQPTPSKPVSHRYAVSVVVLFYRTGGWFECIEHSVSVRAASHPLGAERMVREPLEKKYRECNGYIVRVKSEQIAD